MSVDEERNISPSDACDLITLFIKENLQKEYMRVIDMSYDESFEEECDNAIIQILEEDSFAPLKHMSDKALRVLFERLLQFIYKLLELEQRGQDSIMLVPPSAPNAELQRGIVALVLRMKLPLLPLNLAANENARRFLG